MSDELNDADTIAQLDLRLLHAQEALIDLRGRLAEAHAEGQVLRAMFPALREKQREDLRERLFIVLLEADPGRSSGALINHVDRLVAVLHPPTNEEVP